MHRLSPTPTGLLVALVLWALGTSCGNPAGDRERILLVTTTSVEASGLLDELVDAYHASQDRFRLSTTAVGSGAALELGRRGDADLLITHDPAAEDEFMAAGYGREQGPVMMNEFVIVGPPADPAGIRGSSDLGAAMARIAASGAPFVSRGDDSGTHSRELHLRAHTGGLAASPPDSTYVEAGSGMGETLRMADQLRAYTLTDLGTFRHLRSTLDLERLAEGEPPEMNPYRYTVPREPLNLEGALDFRDWLVGPGQAVIESFGIERFGEPLFAPATDQG